MMDMDNMISLNLRIGVILCIILVVIGTALIFVNGGGGGFSVSQLMNLSTTANSSQFGILQIINGVENLDGLSIIMLGLIVLMATPIIRVFLSIIYFAMQKNRLYTAITVVVMIDLLIAILVVPGLIGH